MNTDRVGAPMHRRLHGQSARTAPTPRVSLLAFGLLLAGATAGIFLAGGPPQGSLGIFLLCAGAALTICPPQVKVEWRLWLVSSALVGCGALAFLPARWFGVPAWRRTLEAAPAIHLPATITTMPSATGFYLALLAISLLTGLFLLAHPVRSQWLLAFALVAALIAGIYGALAIYAKQTGWHYAFAADATFGFFPNRNHTATLLIVGSLLALGAVSVLLRAGRWLTALLAAAILTLCVVALGFFSLSRGGIVFLLAGLVLWMAGLGGRHRDPRLLVSLCSLLLASGVLFLVSGSEVRNRLLGLKPAVAAGAVSPSSSPGSASGMDAGDAMHDLSTDFRVKIYRDAADAIRSCPLTGMGMGTFALVFPQYRHASLNDASILHPESDWLMFAAESGVTGVLCLLTLIALATARLGPEREHPYWPLRWGCAAAAGAAALHGLVDVPLHRVQMGWWVLVVAGLALQSVRAGAGHSRTQHALFFAGGLSALLLGGQLVRAEWFHGPPLPPFVLAGVPDRVYRAYRHKDLDGARRLAEQTIQACPLYDPTYFQLGVLLSQSRANDAAVDAVFTAQRLVEPIHPDTAFHQGEIWFANDPDRVAALWLDALARRERIAKADGENPDAVLGYYRDLVGHAAEQPDTQTDLWNATRQNLPYAFVWLEKAEPDLVREQMARLAVDDGFLRGLDEAARRHFLRVWYARGDREAFARFVNGRTDWAAAAWAVHVRTLIDAQQFEAAVREVSQRDDLSLDLPATVPAESAARSMLAVPLAGGDPARIFAAYWQSGDTATAGRILDEALASGSGSRSAELWRLQAAVSAHQADWPAAWHAVEEYVRLTRPNE